MNVTTENRPSSREGSIIGVVLVVLLVLSLLALSLLRLAAADAQEAGSSIASTRAFWAAEAGIEEMKALGVKRVRPYTQIIVNGSAMHGNAVLNGAVPHGNYVVDVIDDPAWTNATRALKKYIIRSTGRSGSAVQTVQLKAQIESFASYMHASHLERSNNTTPVYFGPGDVIDGPVYVNDRLNIAGGTPMPVFLQHVSSASNVVNYVNGANSSVFQRGLTLGAPPLDISGQFTSDHINDVKADALLGGLSLSGNYRMDFNPNGTLTYRLASGPTTTTTVSLATLNGAIYVNGSAYVNGTLRGEVTLAAQNSIFISNRIVYASATNPSPWSAGFNTNNVTDMLGLMASNQVQIVGTNEVTIHAAIMVTSDGGGFNAERYSTSIGAPHINLFGSLSQYRRGVVGQSGSGALRGYRKNYKFDARYEQNTPPNFPYSMYRFSDWKSGYN